MTVDATRRALLASALPWWLPGCATGFGTDLDLNGIPSCGKQRCDRHAAYDKCELDMKFHFFSCFSIMIVSRADAKIPFVTVSLRIGF